MYHSLMCSKKWQSDNPKCWAPAADPSPTQKYGYKIHISGNYSKISYQQLAQAFLFQMRYTGPRLYGPRWAEHKLAIKQKWPYIRYTSLAICQTYRQTYRFMDIPHVLGFWYCPMNPVPYNPYLVYFNFFGTRKILRKGFGPGWLHQRIHCYVAIAM